jgi:hypothetical protein
MTVLAFELLCGRFSLFRQHIFPCPFWVLAFLSSGGILGGASNSRNGLSSFGLHLLLLHLCRESEDLALLLGWRRPLFGKNSGPELGQGIVDADVVTLLILVFFAPDKVFKLRVVSNLTNFEEVDKKVAR